MSTYQYTCGNEDCEREIEVEATINPVVPQTWESPAEGVDCEFAPLECPDCGTPVDEERLREIINDSEPEYDEE